MLYGKFEKYTLIYEFKSPSLFFNSESLCEWAAFNIERQTVTVSSSLAKSKRMETLVSDTNAFFSTSNGGREILQIFNRTSSHEACWSRCSVDTECQPFELGRQKTAWKELQLSEKSQTRQLRGLCLSWIVKLTPCSLLLQDEQNIYHWLKSHTS